MRLSPRLREQYPEEMTIVLQHQFWDLKVSDDAFEVGLSFGGVPERLLVPFEAIKGFFDPSVQFGLQFETIDAGGAKPAAEQARSRRSRAKPQAKPTSRRAPARRTPRRTSVRASPPASRTGPAATADKPAARSRNSTGSDKPGAEVVRLDRFRKK